MELGDRELFGCGNLNIDLGGAGYKDEAKNLDEI
jgi:hypothetical protein